MAEALIRGMLQASLFDPANIFVIDISDDRLAYLKDTYHINTSTAPEEFSSHAEVIIFAVKPQMISVVASQYQEILVERHLIFSIMAGVSLQSLENYFPKVRRMIRVMPNTPALILDGATAMSANAATTDQDLAIARRLFSAVGLCVEVQEGLLDAVTGLSGSGPAYVFAMIEAMIDGGVLAGLPRPIAEQLTLQTVYGSVKLAMQSSENPAGLTAQVTSPGGTTIHGLYALERHGIRAAYMEAVLKATERSREL